MNLRRLSAIIIAVLLVIALLYAFRTKPQAPTNSGASLTVHTSIYPLAYLAEEVGGNHVAVTTVLPAGADPHDFEISPQQLIQTQQADLFIYNGAGVDQWAERLVSQRPVNRNINMAEALEAAGIELHEAEEHEEEEGHDHDHGDIDPHIWLDLNLMKTQAEIIRDAFIAFDPDHAQEYQNQTAQLLTNLYKLDQQYQSGLANCSLRKIIVTHDAFGYLADAYNFETIAISGISPQDQPSAKELGDIAAIVRREGIGYIFLETLASPKLAQTLASETGAQTLVLNPVEGLTVQEREAGKNYASLMRDNLQQLRLAMKCE